MIEFKNIKLTFDNKKIFDGFNMMIDKGEKILLNAPSGRGKSTLFKMLLGFQKFDEGQIFFNGKKLEKNNLVYFRRNIGYVSQDVDFRNENLWDLINQIFSYRYNKHIEITKEKILDLLEFFSLSPKVLNKQMSQLSGGERQRLGMIICILLDRKVWLLDEITSGLDKDMKERVIQYVLKQDKTILIISHDKNWAENDIVRIEEW